MLDIFQVMAPPITQSLYKDGTRSMITRKLIYINMNEILVVSEYNRKTSS